MAGRITEQQPRPAATCRSNHDGFNSVQLSNFDAKARLRCYGPQTLRLSALDPAAFMHPHSRGLSRAPCVRSRSAIPGVDTSPGRSGQKVGWMSQCWSHLLFITVARNSRPSALSSRLYGDATHRALPREASGSGSAYAHPRPSPCCCRGRDSDHRQSAMR